MGTSIHIDENDLKKGLLGLVVALLDIIKDTLRLQAVKRMEGGSLTEDEIERLGEALIRLEDAMESIKVEAGVADAVRSVRDGLDEAVGEILDAFTPPGGNGAGGLERSLGLPMWEREQGVGEPDEAR